MRKLLAMVLAAYGLIILFRMLERRKIAPSHGRILGLPYDFRLPTSERIREQLWNPKSSRILTPKVFGVGYNLNLAAILRRLGLIQ